MFPVAVANQKGGVGKTTNSINIAGALADRGHDVLLVDGDPQGYLTVTLGFEEQYRGGDATLATALAHPSRIDPDELVQRHPEFGVVPAGGDLRSVVDDLNGAGIPEFGTVRRVLSEASAGRYDFAVVDTPPVQNAYTDLLLGDCGDVFVPMEVSEPSVYSVTSLVDHAVELERASDVSVRIRAVLLSDVNYPLDNEQRRVIRWVEDNFGDRCHVYEIRHRAAIERSLRDHTSVFGPNAEATDMTEVYTEIAAHVERLNPGVTRLGRAKDK
ncbi:MAG: ParA family protein [Halobacteriales archaeon]